MSFATTDLSDACPGQVQFAEPVFRDFGGAVEFHGPARTIKLFEDNSLVRAQLEQPGQGSVLVIDGGGSLRCALVGDQLGDLAVANDWAGILVYGCVRDSVALGRLSLGIKALASHPRKSVKRGVGEQDLVLRFAGLVIKPGDWVYADADGVIVSATELPAA